MRRTPPDLAAPGRRPPTTTWQPDQIPTQRSDDTWRSLERPRSAAPAPATATATATAQPRTHSSSYTSPDGSHWSWDGKEWQTTLDEPVRVSRWGSRVALVGGAALLAALLGGWILHGQGGTVTRAEQVMIHGTLQSAGIAQLAHHAGNLAYAASIDALILSGYEPDPRVTVTVVSATDGNFCLAAGPAGAQPVVWLTQDGESTSPCR